MHTIRPYHTFETLKSLAKNFGAKETDLFAFIDGHNKISEIQLIDNVEKIIKSFSNQFKSITISRSNINLTCDINQKRNITHVLSQYDAVIVVEDDLYISKFFLNYMNNALLKYKHNKKVWHINGFMHPIKINGNFECFFMRSMLSWGWGTWKDRWEDFMDKPLSCDPYYLKSIFTKEMINEFDLTLKKKVFFGIRLKKMPLSN